MHSVIDYINYLERVHKSFIVLLSSFICTEIESLEHKESFTFCLRSVGLTHMQLRGHFQLNVIKTLTKCSCVMPWFMHTIGKTIITFIC